MMEPASSTGKCARLGNHTMLFGSCGLIRAHKKKSTTVSQEEVDEEKESACLRSLVALGACLCRTETGEGIRVSI